MEFIYTEELRALTKAKDAVDMELASVKDRLTSVVGLLQPLVSPAESAELTITRLQTVHLTVQDAASSAKFFYDVFTLPKPEVLVSGDGKTSLVVNMTNMRLELHQEEEESSKFQESQESQESQLPSAHAVRFSTHTASIEAVKRALATRNIAWTYIIPENFHALRFVDLDGYEWEVVDTRDNPVMAFKALVRRDSTDYLGTKEDFSAPQVKKETGNEQGYQKDSKGKQPRGK